MMRWMLMAALLLGAGRLMAAELTVEDFKFDGPLGSEGARIEKLGTNHFQVTLGHAPTHGDWANNCQFEITRHAKGNALKLEVKFGYKKPAFLFDEYFHSWSYDGKSWTPIKWAEKSNGQSNRLEFPTFAQDRVVFGLQVPMSSEDAEALLKGWAKHPHAKLHELGKSLGGRTLYRLEITDPQSPNPRASRWVHYFKNEHPGEHNSQWRLAGMIDWLLSDAGAEMRQRTICHFVLMMCPDGPGKGWYRTGAQGADMNRSYRAAGADAKEQCHEAYVFQKDLEGLMASEAPVTDAWQVHTCGGMVDPMVTAGPEIGQRVGPPEEFKAIMDKNDPKELIKPVRFHLNRNLATWTGGAHGQFGITTVLCEGAGDILTKEENMTAGVSIIKSLEEYYKGLRK